MGTLRKKTGLGLALLLGAIAAASVVVLADAGGVLPAADGAPAAPGVRGTQWILWGLLTAGFGAVFWIWLQRSLLLPLEETASAVRELARGRLDASVPEGACDEIGELGRCINEMTANVQETLLHVWKGTGECRRLIADARRELSRRPDEELNEALSKIDRGQKSIESLRSFVSAFEFYDVQLDPESDRILSDRRGPDAPPGPRRRAPEKDADAGKARPTVTRTNR